MSVVTAEGLVLSRQRSGEADAVFSVLMAEGGERRLKLHGVLSSKKRSNLVSEPGSVISATFYDSGKGIASCKEAVVLDRFDELKDSYEVLQLLSYILEQATLVVRGCEGPELYELVMGSLNEVRRARRESGLKLRAPGQRGMRAEDQAAIHLLLGFLKVRLLAMLGVVGDCQHCQDCGAELLDSAAWAIPEVSFRCEDCSPGAQKLEARHAHWIDVANRRRFTNFVRDIGLDLPLGAAARWDSRLARCLEAFLGQAPGSAKELYRTLATQDTSG